MLHLRSLLATCALAALAPASLRTQPVALNPITSQSGLEAARALAKSSLAGDAALVLIGAVGHSTYNASGSPVELRFYLENGRSTAWAYSFYSPSLNKRALIVGVDIPSVGANVFPGESPVPLPELTGSVDASLPYSGSDAAMARLAADSIFERYRASFPAKLPETIGLRASISSDAALLPAWFPTDKPLWVLNFRGGGDSTLTCFVATGTGATYCTRTIAASAPRHGESDSKMMNLSERSPLRSELEAER